MYNKKPESCRETISRMNKVYSLRNWASACVLETNSLTLFILNMLLNILVRRFFEPAAFKSEQYLVIMQNYIYYFQKPNSKQPKGLAYFLSIINSMYHRLPQCKWHKSLCRLLVESGHNVIQNRHALLKCWLKYLRFIWGLFIFHNEWLKIPLLASSLFCNSLPWKSKHGCNLRRVREKRHWLHIFIFSSCLFKKKN